MADPVISYIRRSRPELASYRSRKSFWEKLADGKESEPIKKPATVPNFGDIRKKFNETNQRRSRSMAKSNESQKRDSLQKNDAAAEERPSHQSKGTFPTKDDTSLRSARRRSLEKPNSKTFLHMTEVMEGYIPSDTDSVASNKDYKLSPNGHIKSSENTKTSTPISTNLAKDGLTKTETTAVESSRKTPSPTSSDGSVRKRNRVRRRGSGRESRYDAVKKEDIVSAGLASVKTEVTSSNQDQAESPITSKEEPKIRTASQDDQKASPKLQRQDSSDNPLKRKRDRKLHKLKLSSPEIKDTDRSSPKTPTYEGKSVLSGIKLTSPKTPPGISIDGSKDTKLKHGFNFNKDSFESSRYPQMPSTHSASGQDLNSSKKQYESVFMGKRRNFIYPSKDSEVQDTADFRIDGPDGKTDKTSDIKVTARNLNPSVDTEDHFFTDSLKASDIVDSSSDTAKVFDTLDSNCSEHRWSTIDSGISVACALQQNSDPNKFSQITVQPALISNEGTRSMRQRQYRRQSSSSDSDDDSGISWDELRDFRDVPLVVVDKVPDSKTETDFLMNKDHNANVKIELENSVDKETEMLTQGLEQKKSIASAIGSRINQRWQIIQEDGSDIELERDKPLRTSTPTGTQVSVVLEPNSSMTESVSQIKSETVEAAVVEPKPSIQPESSFQTPTSRPDIRTRPSRFSRFSASKSPDNSKSKKKKVPTATLR